MSKKIRLKIHNEIAVIRAGDQGIIKLDLASFSQLAGAVKAIDKYDGIKAVFIHLDINDVFICAQNGKKMSDKSLLVAQKKGQELFYAIDNIKVPTVCFIKGYCISTALELALACDYLVSIKDSDDLFGFYDIEQGLIPAMGGIFRLAHKVGLQKCLDIAFSAKELDVNAAKKAGLIDLLVDASDSYEQILDRLKQQEENGGSVTATHRLTRFVSESAAAKKLWFKKARQTVLDETRGFLLAPLKFLDLLEYSQKRELQNYCSMEARVFRELLKTEQSKKLRIFSSLYYSYKKSFAGRWWQKAESAVVVADASQPVDYQDLTHASLVLDFVDDPMVASSISSKCLLAKRIHPDKRYSLNNRHIAFFSLSDDVNSKLVEVLASEQNSLKDIRKVCRFFESVGTVPFVLYRTDRSVVMRLLNVYFAEAKKLVVEGVGSKLIEKASTNFGIKYGPFEFMEKIGIKCWLVDGRDVDELEIQNRLLMPMINEAAQIIGENIGLKATHIDLMMVLVAGFPKFKGGLLRFADSHGLDKIVTQLKKLDYQISPYLNRLVEKGQRFYL